jgi:trehalose-phosphatase
MRILLAFDFDGTLAPIAGVAEEATIAPDAVAFCRWAASLPEVTLAVISGRDLDDVAARTAELHAYRSGSHGLELASPLGERLRSVDARELEPPAALIDAASGAEMRIERKRHGVALHWRGAGEVRRVIDAFRHWARGEGLQTIDGRLVLEARIPGPSKKEMLMELAALTAAERVIYAGDDLTDFEALEWAASHGSAFVVASAERLEYPPRSEVMHSLQELFARLRSALS